MNCVTRFLTDDTSCHQGGSNWSSWATTTHRSAAASSAAASNGGAVGFYRMDVVPAGNGIAAFKLPVALKLSYTHNSSGVEVHRTDRR